MALGGVPAERRLRSCRVRVLRKVRPAEVAACTTRSDAKHLSELSWETLDECQRPLIAAEEFLLLSLKVRSRTNQCLKSITTEPYDFADEGRDPLI